MKERERGQIFTLSTHCYLNAINPLL